MRITIQAVLVALLLPVAVGAAPLPYQVQTLAVGLEFPWSVAFLPDGAALISERPGRLRLLRDGQLHPQPIAGLPPVHARSQGGLLEVLVDPDYASNGWIYLSMASGTNAANATEVVRARLLDHGLTDVQVIFRARPNKSGSAHFGGRMALLGDGTLAIGLGDGFDLREQAQRLDSHLGKIVRVRRDGEVPSDNPFRSRADVLPEIYSYGHRNVQGLVYDSVSGHLYAHEHGPRGGDELNRIEAGGNYGWPLASFGVDYSGARVSPFQEYPQTLAPLLHWTPSIAPAGLTIYHGEQFPQWQGDLFVAALAGRHLRRVRLHDSGVVEQEELLTELEERLRDVRTAPDGSLWVLTDSLSGRLFRLSAPISPEREEVRVSSTEIAGAED